MTALAKMTDDDFKELLNDYFAPKESRRKLSAIEVNDIASRLNAIINVPLITEEREESILVKVVLKIDNFLYDNLPNEFYDLIRSIDKGIDDEEAKRLIARLSRLANDRIDIPYIPEAAEYVAIKYVIGVVINSARKKWSLDKTKDVTEKELVAEVV